MNIANVGEVFGFATHLVRIAQCHRTKALAEWLKSNRPLAVCQHHATDTQYALAAHRFPYNREGLFADLVRGGDVVDALHIADIDLAARDKAEYANGVGALAAKPLDVLILHRDVLIPFDLIAT